MATLDQSWNQFVAERSITLCPTSLTADYRTVSKWVTKCPIQDLTEGRQIMTWVLQQQPVKTSRRVAMYIRSLYRWASNEDIGLIDRNPILSFRMPKPPQEDEDIIVIPRNEVSLVLIALKGRTRVPKYDWCSYAEIMLQTAMRTGEVRALQWKDIKDNKILVHSNYTLTHGYKNSTKTNKKRWVPLNQRCLEILKDLPQNDQYIFPYNRYAYQSWFYDRMKELHAAQLIQYRYRPYDLRHTAISRWIEAQIPVAQVSAWAGNSSEVIWKHYCNVTQEYEMPTL
jgi:integrase